MLLKKILFTIVLGSSFILNKGVVFAKDNYQINLGYYNCDHMTAAPVAEKTGIYKDLGLDVVVTGNGKVPQAMVAGRMDVGYIGINSVFKSSEKGVPLVVAANNHKGGSFYLVVSNKINSPQELIGKTLAIGTEPEDDTAWMQIADELKIPREGKAYKAIDMDSGPNQVLALERGQIDGFTNCDPWASLAEYRKVGKIMGIEKKLSDGTWGICCAYAFNKKFITEHPELAVKMIKAHELAIEYIYIHPIKSAKIFSEAYKIPYEVALMTIYKKTVGEGRTLTWDLKEKEIRNELKFVQENNFTSKDVTFEKVVDMDIYKKANLRDFDTFIKENVASNYPEGMSYEEWLKKAKELDV